MKLKTYRQKRNFKNTPEPRGAGTTKRKKTEPLRFVVQMHDASRMHFDLRLEFGGVFRSWAVPKGFSLNPQTQRLAVFVEDHPLEYGTFEGVIPKGNYGAGTVLLWDQGTYVERGSETRAESEAAMEKGLAKGHITFVLDGEKLKGEYALVKLKTTSDPKAWILIKKRDEFASSKRDAGFDDLSVKTGRSMAQIAAQAEKAGDVWVSHRKTSKTAATEAKPAPNPTAHKTAKPGSKPTSRSLAKPRTAQPTQTQTAPTRTVQPTQTQTLPKATRSPAPTRTRTPASRATKSARANAKNQRTSLPRNVKPMQAAATREAPKGKNWIFEPELKGLRALAEIEGHRVRLYSRAGLSFNARFPKIVGELAELGHELLLDGEIVDNRYHVYDLLYKDGQNLRDQPLKERRRELTRVIHKLTHIVLVESSATPEHPRVIAKDLTSSYQSGISKAWLASPGATKTGAKIIEREADQPRLTNLSKIYWPDERLTKGDLIEYYRQAAPYILPYLKDRPESLNRHPNGITAKGFYQKDMTGHVPRFLKTKQIYSESSGKSINYALVQNEVSLLYIVNLGCIEIHPWFSRVQSLDHPDFLVIDLDPDDNDFNDVIEVAHAFHKLLDKIKVPNFLKTSGATGLHIGVPTGARHDFDRVRAFAESVCALVQQQFPKLTSIERNTDRRRGKIYLDYMQNRRGQTLAAPYCVRPRPGAPVSMPLHWSELKRGLKPEQFNIHNAIAKIAKRKDDPFAGVLGPALDLPAAERRLKNL